MKIVFMGTPEFAVPSLEKLVEVGHEIPLVVTQPDRKGNRGKVTFSPVKECAIQHNIPVEQPYQIREDEEFMAKLESLQPDFIVVAAFGQILPERVLNIPKYDCVNVHGSLLPKLRGAAPMQYSILQGDSVSGVTIMKMAKGLDTGDMISQAEMNIEGMTIHEFSEKLAILGADLLVKTLPEIADGNATYTPQNEEESSYASMIRKTDGLTDFSGSAAEEERKIRAYDPWPALYSYLNGKQMKFFQAEVLEDDEEHAPGVISAVDKNSFTVDCGRGRLRILEVQLQGKKRMSAGDFLRGTGVSKGDRLTKGE
ncbi:MAG: methionyl-tRNA formyltransferase [Eubacteriales bacterium]|nr:methionyl-tRNA formyltransferase [Eubacteriales bacterium]